MITDLASGWKQWFADDFSVSVTFPGDYRVVKAVSEGAELVVPLRKRERTP